jgi:hypothetical protein
MISAMATADTVDYWPNVNGTASSNTVVDGTVFAEENIDLDTQSNFEAQRTVDDGSANAPRTYSKLNIYNAPLGGGRDDGSIRYDTNIKGYYETFNGSSSNNWTQTWEVTGNYNFTGLTNNYLQFGVNTNPPRPLNVPGNAGDSSGAIVFTLRVNDVHIITQGFTSGVYGEDLAEMNQSTLGDTGYWSLIIEFDGIGNTNLDPLEDIVARFDAYIGVSNQSFSIPAPGVLAVLGLGGIAARRRRK